MKFSHYLSRVEESKEFKDFRKKNKKAHLCAGFFVLDFETGKNMHQVDYCLPNRRIATFILDEGVNFKISEQAIKKELPEISKNAELDLDALKGIVEDEMKNHTVTEQVKKIIAILHVLDNKLVWNLQCILSGLEILNIHIDDSDGSILKFEKHSLLEMIKTLPSSAFDMKNLKLPQEKQEKTEEGKTSEKGK